MSDDIDAENLERTVARANANTASAVTRLAGLSSTPHTEGVLRGVHPALCESYTAVCRALDAVERELDRLDDAREGQPTPRRLKRDRADSIQVEFDGPVVTVALMLLEANRREWLHHKDNTFGAEEVRKNGLTATQFHQLERLQRAWDAYDDGAGDGDE